MPTGAEKPNPSHLLPESGNPAVRRLPTPGELRAEFRLSATAAAGIAASRQTILDILAGRDRRLLTIVGPCSVHDAAEALAYGRWLQLQATRHEKSRTGAGWRGLVRSPLPATCLASQADQAASPPTDAHATDRQQRPDDTAEGLRQARDLLCQLAEHGLPLAVELVSPLLWPYWADCASWVAVGARGVESAALREAASALPCASGFKNATDGQTDSARLAVATALRPSTVLTVDEAGVLVELLSRGNPLPHVVLRGGRNGDNLVQAAPLAAQLAVDGLPAALLVDASHGNSGFRPETQAGIVRCALELRRQGLPVRGLLIESYLRSGAQPLDCGAPGTTSIGQRLQAGLSVTDPCLGQAETASLLDEIAAALK